jgi:hypothetical protein
MEGFTPVEQSKELKKLGFNEPCLAAWEFEKWMLGEFRNSISFKLCEKTEVFPAPTFSQAFKFVRDKHEIFGEIIMHIPEDGELDGCITYLASVSKIMDYKKHTEILPDLFPTYEKAELACLSKMIEEVK